MVPKYLYHYYERERDPFLSISDTDELEFRAIMANVGDSPILDNRFDTQEKKDFYYFFRHYTERKIRSMFIEKGGQPVLKSPRYMTLGPTTWFLDWYEDAIEVEIPLEAFRESVISFTYPDSMMSMLLAEDRYEPFRKYKEPYHGKVFVRSELEDVIKKYGLPDENNIANIEHGNRIIEAQIWDMTIIDEYVLAFS